MFVLEKNRTSFQNKSIKEPLKYLHVGNVISPIYKTNDNVALLLKRFYALTLPRILGIND